MTAQAVVAVPEAGSTIAEVVAVPEAVAASRTLVMKKPLRHGRASPFT